MTKEPVIIGDATLYNMDCMEFLRAQPDKSFDLAIVDPPYGIGAGKMQMGKGKNKQWSIGKNWDNKIPSENYFNELCRVSNRQIIWGGNYFNLPPTGGWIYWNKERQKEVSFADGELAWTSFLTVLKEAKIKYDGFLGADIDRIHPTQKPIKLYEWLLTNYSENGKRILDTHLGSGSSAIAAKNFGCQFIGCEIDEDYFKAACDRLRKSHKQIDIFSAASIKQEQASFL